MKEKESIKILIAQIERHRGILDEIFEELGKALKEDVPTLGRTKRTALMTASIVESYYTCAETIFLRISQFFENNLQEGRWHRDLLEKMTLQVPDIRPRVVSEPVHEDLAELLRFRHFKRYYLGFAYDWE
ncbi:MAG: hypothetical protein JW860_09955, partial [Sedimentisphaerales bacterium]|nr:hypothetical protein [Sedimentisphaerales bacterium]